MVDRYVEDKIRAALDKAGGSRMQAMKLIAQAAQNDERLLRGLAQPHFQGLVAYATDRVMRKHNIKAVPEPEQGAHQGRGDRVQGNGDPDGKATEQILQRLRQRAHQNAREEPGQKPAKGGGTGGVSQQQGLAAVVAEAKGQQAGGQGAGRQHVSAVRSLAKGQRGSGR